MSDADVVLFVSASPSDQKPVDVNEEYRAVEDAILKSKYRDRLAVRPALAARPGDLITALRRYEPAVLHFSGHGSASQKLIFQDEAGDSAPLPGSALRDILAVAGSSLRMVVLSACYSASHARVLRDTVGLAVGMADPIYDETAITFSPTFYSSLAYGCSPEEAFKSGVAALKAVESPDVDVPRLIKRRGVGIAAPFLTETGEPIVTHTLELVPPRGMWPEDGYDYGVQRIREGTDEDPRRNDLVDYVWLERRGAKLVADVKYRRGLGLQYKCFVDCPRKPSLDTLRSRFEAVGWSEPTYDKDPRRIWFLLRGEADYTSRDGFHNNYLRYAPAPRDRARPRDRATPGTRVSARGTGATRPTARGNGAVRTGRGRSRAAGVASANGAARKAPAAAARPPVITDDVDAFRRQLHPGDVLLFDTIHPLSDLIKLAENRPVNHAALYIGDGRFAHATRHTATAPAVRTETFTRRLGAPPGPYDRTVTALRHRSAIDGPGDAHLVVQRAEVYLTSPTRYAYLHLIELMGPALLRAYAKYFRTGRAITGVVGHLVEVLSDSMLTTFEPDVAVRTGRHDKPTLTCSEFVYRCYQEAGPALAIEVSDPILWWKDGRRFVPPRRRTLRAAGVAGVEEIAGVDELVGFHRALELPGARAVARADRQSRGAAPRTTATRAAGAGAETWRDLVTMVRETAAGFVLRNRRLSKYGPDEATDGKPVPDLITPRDLWSSADLVACAVLHRPPSRLDERLDDVQHH